MTCPLDVCCGSGVVLTRDGVQACVCRVGRALAAAADSDLFGDLLAAQQAAEQANDEPPDADNYYDRADDRLIAAITGELREP